MANTNPRHLTIESIAAAVAIAVVFTALGRWIGKQENSQYEEISINNWIGIWDTNTATYKNLRIIFHKEDNKIIGTYNYSSSNKIMIDGKIEAKVDKYSIIGKWIEINEGKKLDGLIHFVLLPDQKSYLGCYTRSWEGNEKRYVWSGLKIAN